MITKDEKRFLKWIVFAALWAVLVWMLTDWGFLASTGTGVTLFIIFHSLYRHRNEKTARESIREETAAYTALYRKFGRWMYLAQYGPLVLLMLGCWVLNHRGTAGPRWTLGNWSGTWGFLVFAVSFGFFILWGLYLCWLVADYKADLKAELEAELKGEVDDGKII